MYVFVRPNRNKGFTLVEAIFSLGVVGVLIICLYSAFSSGYSGVQFSREDARATQILVAKMDQMRLFSWDQISTNGVPDEFAEHFNPEQDVAPLQVGKKGKGKKKGKNQPPLVYIGEIKIKDGPGDVTYKDDIKEIEIELEWVSQNGMTRKRKLTTYIARYGLQNYVY